MKIIPALPGAARPQNDSATPQNNGARADAFAAALSQASGATTAPRGPQGAETARRATHGGAYPTPSQPDPAREDANGAALQKGARFVDTAGGLARVAANGARSAEGGRPSLVSGRAHPWKLGQPERAAARIGAELATKTTSAAAPERATRERLESTQPTREKRQSEALVLAFAGLSGSQVPPTLPNTMPHELTLHLPAAGPTGLPPETPSPTAARAGSLEQTKLAAAPAPRPQAPDGGNDGLRATPISHRFDETAPLRAPVLSGPDAPLPQMTTAAVRQAQLGALAPGAPTPTPTPSPAVALPPAAAASPLLDEARPLGGGAEVQTAPSETRSRATFGEPDNTTRANSAPTSLAQGIRDAVSDAARHIELSQGLAPGHALSTQAPPVRPGQRVARQAEPTAMSAAPAELSPGPQEAVTGQEAPLASSGGGESSSGATFGDSAVAATAAQGPSGAMELSSSAAETASAETSVAATPADAAATADSDVVRVQTGAAGTVEARVQAVGNELLVQVRTEDPAHRQALIANIRTLEAELAQANPNASRVVVSEWGGGEMSTSHERGRDNSGRRPSDDPLPTHEAGGNAGNTASPVVGRNARNIRAIA